MSFASPLALLALLLIPLVVLLHFISARWKSREVSSLALWEEALRQVQSRLRIRRLLRTLALLAEVLGIAVLALALARPEISRPRIAAAGDTVLVLDTTASMQAKLGRGTRWNLARAKALELVASMGPGARMAILGAGRQPRLLAPFTEDRQALRRAVLAASASDEAGSPEQSLLFALGLREPGRHAQVVFITDGAFSSLGGTDLSSVQVVLVGAASNQDGSQAQQSGQGNVGITALQFRRSLSGERELFLSIESRMTTPVTLPLEITVDRAASGSNAAEGSGATGNGPRGTDNGGRTDDGGAAANPAIERSVTLKPGEALPLSLPWNGSAEGKVTARLKIDDSLAADNVAYAVLAPARQTRVLLVGNDDPFLKAALSSFPGLRLTRLERLDPAVSAQTLEGWDMVIFVGVEPPPLEAGKYLLFGAVPSNLPLRALGKLSRPRFEAWDRSHPALASLSLADVAIDQALRVSPGEGTRIIARSRDAPLMVTWEREGLRVLFVAFEPERSDLPLRPAFPMLMANALAWFTPGLLGGEAVQAHPGQTVEIPVTEGARTLTSTGPDGVRHSWPVTGTPFALSETSRAGFYRIEAGGETRELAVSLCDSAETDISPRYASAQSGAAVAGAAGPTAPAAESRATASPTAPAVSVASTRGPAWPLFALVAFALIVAEGALWLTQRSPGAASRPGGTP